jgi:hypothetical protein
MNDRISCGFFNICRSMLDGCIGKCTVKQAELLKEAKDISRFEETPQADRRPRLTREHGEAAAYQYLQSR